KPSMNLRLKFNKPRKLLSCVGELDMGYCLILSISCLIDAIPSWLMQKQVRYPLLLYDILLTYFWKVE
ncbi:Pol polyprotein, partial [Schistosoma japonicum]